MALGQTHAFFWGASEQMTPRLDLCQESGRLTGSMRSQWSLAPELDPAGRRPGSSRKLSWIAGSLDVSRDLACFWGAS